MSRDGNSTTGSRRTAFQRARNFLSSRDATTWHIVICIILTVLILVVAAAITTHLILGDVDDYVQLENGPEKKIGLLANFLNIDPTTQTVTVDWFPAPYSCSESEELVVNIFVDPNLLVASGDNTPTASTAAPTVPIFQLNTTEKCSSTNYDSFPEFRTSIKLTGMASSGSLGRVDRRSLQAYPFDLYFFQVSMFAKLNSTNESVGINLEKSFGVPINFEVALNKAQSSNTADGILLYFSVSRSTAVIALVIIVVVANWLVTIAFLWVTVAAFIWPDEVVSEMFAVPIATLFAFTSVRANLPGAPTGFGAVIDYYGVLPNLGLITLFGAILLIGVLHRRIAEEHEKHKKLKKQASGDVESQLKTPPTPAKESTKADVEENVPFPPQDRTATAMGQELGFGRPAAPRARSSATFVETPAAQSADLASPGK
ncbi:hypothetical protein B0H19DRAFT_1250735 [Mycena capillaripes]|nr:hypothetical protein B0H19DRAFT_1250735 [Mycena capillaripes]